MDKMNENVRKEMNVKETMKRKERLAKRKLKWYGHLKRIALRVVVAREGEEKEPVHGEEEEEEDIG